MNDSKEGKMQEMVMQFITNVNFFWNSMVDQCNIMNYEWLLLLLFISIITLIRTGLKIYKPTPDEVKEVLYLRENFSLPIINEKHLAYSEYIAGLESSQVLPTPN